MALASASGEMVPSLRTTLAMRSSRRKAMPAIPRALFTEAAISPATKVPCPFVSLCHELGTKLAPPTTCLEIRMICVDARVDHRDPNAQQRRQLGPGVERVNAVEVPLTHRERVVRREGEAARGAQPLDPRDAADRAEGLSAR